jgi:hypothetical protein
LRATRGSHASKAIAHQVAGVAVDPAAIGDNDDIPVDSFVREIPDRVGWHLGECVFDRGGLTDHNFLVGDRPDTGCLTIHAQFIHCI